MARIQTYQNDATVTLDDKVIGTDAVDNSTKNFTVGDILALGGGGGTTYTAGTGIDITNNIITCTVTDTNTTYTAGTGIDITNDVITCTVTDTNTDTKPEILVAVCAANLPTEPSPIAVPFVLPAGSDIATESLHINYQGNLSIGNDWVRNDSGNDINVKITMHGFSVANSNNLDINYILQSSSDGISWANVKTVSRTKSAPGEYADMFGAYFRMPAGEYFRISVYSTTGNVDFLAGSQIEFVVH